MQRIYLPKAQFGDKLLITDKELYHQITRVMRARVGQAYIFFDGKNNHDYKYEIVDINKSDCSFKLIETIKTTSELDRELTLYQAIPNKIAKLETIVQKSCEVGYRTIVFFEGENSQKLVLSQLKKERLYKIAIEAIEQCGGNMIPEIIFFDKLGLLEGNTIFCHTKSQGAQKLSEIPIGKTVNIVVGPEGGLSDREVLNLESSGAQRVFFGSRIYRCETVAPLVGFYLAQKKES